ncbi:glycosyltransferase [Sulfurovum sp. ST-21]|uniref:Glycosyltransferase n=1 Tax=Sulfurovum indicum TaxID=2779528 RepID=A0A7M1S591_9BACT|nr:glycosyltransferase [Sulfurovum indicum]QOR62334.1 glycosyltransferase [Sulfurovum indicum]
MKRIGVVVTNLAGSGAEKVALTQAKLFREKGHEVALFLLDNIQKYNTDDCDFPIVPLSNGKDTYKFLGRLGDFIYAKILESKMKKIGKFDLVISNLPRADRVVKLLAHHNKYFVIHISYKAELEKFSKKRARKKLKLYKFLYENENIITVANDIIKDFDVLDIKYKSATTIYNPFDFEEIKSKGNEAIEIGYEYIISPSAFREQKRYDVMLDAFKMIEHDIKLVILANSDDKLTKMIQERDLEDKVVVLGFQQNPYKYMKNAKLMIMGSDYEGFGMVIVESLILNTPVVSTDCPTGPREILTGDLSKWLVPVNNPKALAQKIDHALESNILIDEESINKFNKEYIYKEFEALWEK